MYEQVKFWGCEKNFGRNFPKLAWKNSKENGKWPPKNDFFKSQHFKHHFCPNFPNLPKKTKSRQDLQIKKKRLDFYFGCHFCKIKAHRPAVIFEGFHTFCPNFCRFFPNFHQIKNFEGALAPPAPPPPTPVDKVFMKLAWILVGVLRETPI